MLRDDVSAAVSKGTGMVTKGNQESKVRNFLEMI